MPELTIVAARSKNNVIGRYNSIPWRAKGEQALFKRITMGGSLIMGRRTFDSIGRPLPGRETLIITRDRGFTAEGCRVAHSLEEALELAASLARPAHVVGGGEIYAQALPLVDCVHLSTIDLEVEGDTFFPEFPTSDFVEVERIWFDSNINYLYQRFDRVKAT